MIFRVRPCDLALDNIIFCVTQFTIGSRETDRQRIEKDKFHIVVALYAGESKTLY